MCSSAHAVSISYLQLGVPIRFIASVCLPFFGDGNGYSNDDGLGSGDGFTNDDGLISGDGFGDGFSDGGLGNGDGFGMFSDC